ncbi:MAG: hypothetical protein KDK29_19950, partial [Sedimentitalea sp.]|nr:hypothetical protein [Sedimentitalea sp.]
MDGKAAAQSGLRSRGADPARRAEDAGAGLSRRAGSRSWRSWRS